MHPAGYLWLPCHEDFTSRHGVLSVVAYPRMAASASASAPRYPLSAIRFVFDPAARVQDAGLAVRSSVATPFDYRHYTPWAGCMP